MDLFYRKIGQGPNLVILHGLYGSSDNWMNYGRLLSKYFTVYLIDQRNHGRSPHSDSHTYDDLANDLKQFLEEHNIEKTSIIGHSMGGKVAMEFTIRFPEKINHLVVVDIAPKSYAHQVGVTSQAMDHKNIVKGLLDAKLNVRTREEIDMQLENQIPYQRVRQFLLKNLGRNDDKTFYWKLNVSVIAKSLEHIMGGIDLESLDAFDGVTGFPVLFIRGGKSRYVLEEDVELIKQIFPVAELKTIPDAGHWLHAEQPDLFWEMIKDFLVY